VREGYDPTMGARPLRRAVRRYIEDPLAEKVLSMDESEKGEIEADIGEDGEVEFRLISSALPAESLTE